MGEKDGESDGWDDDQGDVGLEVAWVDADEWMDSGLLGEVRLTKGVNGHEQGDVDSVGDVDQVHP